MSRVRHSRVSIIENPKVEEKKNVAPTSFGAIRFTQDRKQCPSIISAFERSKRASTFVSNKKKNSFYGFEPPSTEEMAKLKRESVLMKQPPVEEEGKRKKGTLSLSYRNFSENVLVEATTFLLAVNKELEDLHLRLCVENEEYFALFDNDSNDTSHRHSTVGVPEKPPVDKLKGLKQSAPRRTAVSVESGVLHSGPLESPGRFSNGFEEANDTHSVDSDGDIEVLMKRTRFPYFAENYGFRYPSELWFSPWSGVPPPRSMTGSNTPVSIAVTEEPPLFLAGMLVDPVSGQFLFGGAAFTEEARVLSAPIPRDQLGLAAAAAQKRDLLKNLASKTRVVKILMREYKSVSEIHPQNRLGGFMVQTMSLLSSEVEAEVDKKNTLHPRRVRELLPFTLSGCLTRVFGFPTESNNSFDFRQEESIRDGSLRVTEEDAKEVTEDIFEKNNPNNYPALSVPQREPMDEEVDLQTTNPTLFLRLMQKDPATFPDAADKIRTALLYHHRNVTLAEGFRKLIRTTVRVQKFIRNCLAKRERALERMLKTWRLLELECKFKLMHYKPPPSSVERIDMIANNVLQQYITTTREEKVKIIKEMWEERQKRYREYQRQKHYDEWVRHAVDIQNDQPDAVHNIIATAVAFDKEAPPTHQSSLKDLSPPHRRKTDVLDQWSQRRSSASSIGVTLPNAALKREADFIHENFGWYIPPEKLLYESHKRLLRSFKGSVLTTEYVQKEVERRKRVETTERPPPANPTGGPSTSKGNTNRPENKSDQFLYKNK